MTVESVTESLRKAEKSVENLFFTWLRKNGFKITSNYVEAEKATLNYITDEPEEATFVFMQLLLAVSDLRDLIMSKNSRSSTG